MSLTLADQLFRRFDMVFGAQKMAALWGREAAADVRAVWNEQLRRWPPTVLARATQSVVDDGLAWPPTLPEFVARCRQFSAAAHQPHRAALEAPRSDIRTAQAAIAKAREAVRAKSVPDAYELEPDAPGLRGQLLATYRAEMPKQREGLPNRAWAARLLLQLADGKRITALQAEFAAMALGLKGEDVRDLGGAA